MKRKQFEALIKWKNQEKRNPLFITGAKGVGKTYLVLEFIKDFFRNPIYFNFEQNPQVKHLFQTKSANDFQRVLMEYFHTELAGDGVIVLDEVQYCREAFALISILQKEMPCIFVIYITSLCKDEQLLEGAEVLNIYPLDFREFLGAVNFDWYGEIVEEHFCANRPVPDILHSELLMLLNKYLITGGLPGAVEEYARLNTTLNISQYHQTVECWYMEYLNSLLEDGAAVRVRNIYDTIDTQLCKKNKKFQYSLIRKGSTKAQYDAEINHLLAYRLLLQSRQMNKNAFKLYMSDVGMLMSKGTKNAAYRDEDTRYEFSRGLLENYVGQTLFQNGFPLKFWESESKARIDFIVETKDEYIPIELYIDDNTRSRNVSEFSKEYPAAYQMKLSTKNFGWIRGVKYVPLYAAFCIRPDTI